MHPRNPLSSLSYLAALIGGLLLVGCAEAPDAAESVGQSEAPVVGGRAAEVSDIQATVLLVDADYEEFFCTGTLISPTVVVSAGHCLEGMEPAWVEVHAGELDATDDVPAEQVVAAARVEVHPDYDFNVTASDPDGLDGVNDIGLIVLQEAVTVMTPVPVLPLARVDELLQPGTMLTITGFGVNDIQQYEAGKLYTADTPFQRHAAGELLAGGPDLPDTCSGDSGGPAYLEVEGQTHLVGATSRAAASAQQECGGGGVYALVPAFQDWIDAVSGVEPPDDGGGDLPGDDEPGPGDDDPGAQDPGDDVPTGDNDDAPMSVDESASGGCSATGVPADTSSWLPLIAAVALLRRRRRTC
jgi:uncharacterized protein (TIGR03382 family)